MNTLSLIRYSKKLFIRLQLHRVFGVFETFFLNLAYLSKFSRWVNKNKAAAYNDFPATWDYAKRYNMYQWLIEKEQLNKPVNYLEFGVASGASFKWFLQHNTNAESRFYGFDTFDGLPEDWGPFKKGAFSTNNQLPEINDARGKFYKGLFQQTLHDFLKEFDNTKRNVILMDADLYSATLYVLTSLAPYLKRDDIILFDQFVVPTHEYKAFVDLVQSYYLKLQLIAAANNYYFVAFKVV